MRTPSLQQQAVIDFVKNDSRSAVVEAVAGSGKTTTLEMLGHATPSSNLVVALAFNKSAAVNMQERFPKWIQSKTFHSHSFNALQRALPKRPRVDADKVCNILKEQLTEKEFFTYGPFVQRLVGYAKNAGIGHFTDIEDSEQFFALIAYLQMYAAFNEFDEGKAVLMAQQALEENNARNWVIDFDDMLYLTLLLNCRFDKCNYVLLDEAQDTNSVQRALLHRMFAANGRLIAVGDSHQAIYAFRGASANAMDEIADEFKCEKFPLSVSYRCAQNIVKNARDYVSHIEPHPNAPAGEISHVITYVAEDFRPQDVVLCRNTAPLVGMAFSLIKRGRGVRILGREIGQGLITLIRKMNSPNSVDTMLEKLERFRSREVEKMTHRGQDAAAEVLTDRCDCINIFADALDEDNRSVAELMLRIESLFNDQTNGGLLTLCSVHKAKGLEWDVVNILDFDKYMPSPHAKQEWQIKQETNLIYVAITRAKQKLRYISSGCWKEAKTEEQKSSRFVMNKEQQRITIAKACGWIDTAQAGTVLNSGEIPCFVPYGRRPGMTCREPLPDYPSDLNAMHEAEKGLTKEQELQYRQYLVHGGGDVFATAAQRAEAFLKTLNLWTETRITNPTITKL